VNLEKKVKYKSTGGGWFMLFKDIFLYISDCLISTCINQTRDRPFSF
jgi:hypothetical protein